MDKSIVINKRKRTNKSTVVKKRKKAVKSIMAKKKKKPDKSIVANDKANQYCVAKNCNKKLYKTNEQFYRFPKDVARATAWAIECGREDLLQNVGTLYKYHKLCGDHFENKMFFNDRRKRLLSYALPTIFPSLEESSSVGSDNCDTVPSICEPTTGEEVDDDNGCDRSFLTTTYYESIPESETDLIEKEVLSRFSVEKPSYEELRKTIKSLQGEIHQLHRMTEECERRWLLMRKYLRPRLKIRNISKRGT